MDLLPRVRNEKVCGSSSLCSPSVRQSDNLGAGEVTVLDLEDSEGLMRLAGLSVVL